MAATYERTPGGNRVRIIEKLPLNTFQAPIKVNQPILLIPQFFEMHRHQVAHGHVPALVYPQTLEQLGLVRGHLRHRCRYLFLTHCMQPFCGSVFTKRQNSGQLCEHFTHAQLNAVGHMLLFKGLDCGFMLTNLGNKDFTMLRG